MLVCFKSLDLEVALKGKLLLLGGSYERSKSLQHEITNMASSYGLEFCLTKETDVLSFSARLSLSSLCNFSPRQQQVKTSHKSTWQLVQHFNSISSAPVVLPHQTGEDRKRAQILCRSTLPFLRNRALWRVLKRQRWPTLQCFTKARLADELYWGAHSVGLVLLTETDYHVKQLTKTIKSQVNARLMCDRKINLSGRCSLNKNCSFVLSEISSLF